MPPEELPCRNFCGTNPYPMAQKLKYYAAFLREDKWISKTDFIYQLKVNCDCTEDDHGEFLQFLYRLHFSRVKRSRSGGILFY